MTARIRPAARPSCGLARAGRTALWEPFSQRYEGLYRVTRSLSKSVYSNKLIFEEVNHDLALSFSCAWMTSDRFGFVRRSALVNLGAEPVEADLLDGIQNLLPHGLSRRFQMEYSTLGGRLQGERTGLRNWSGPFQAQLRSSRPARAE
jgi:hypothetical protein